MPRLKRKAPNGTDTAAMRLAKACGLRAPTARAAIRELYAIASGERADVRARRDAWRDHLIDATGVAPDDLASAMKPIATACDLQAPSPAELLFAAQTYYALAVKLLLWTVLTRPGESAASEPPLFREIERREKERRDLRELLARIESGEAFRELGAPSPCGGDDFSWPVAAWSEAVARCVADLMHVIEGLGPGELQWAAATGHDLLAMLYQELFPQRVRQVLGEFYTPSWLADRVLDAAEYDASPETRVLDPACGSGTFLLRAIKRLKHALHEEGRSDEEVAKAILENVVGYDLNPIAVLSASAGYLLALGPLARGANVDRIPVYLHDSIRCESAPSGDRPFDLVVGNPPWIAWDRLPDAYRDATKPLWREYGLFSLSGGDARHGGGKKDLSTLMIYRAADRFLRDGGRLAMVVTQTVLQTRGAGDGFRRFRLGEDGPPLRVLHVDDMADIRPFADASNWSATIVLERGAETTYPVPYVRWFDAPRENGARVEPPYAMHEGLAEPIDPDRPTSPWIARPTALKRPLRELTGPSDYAGHLGANSGGANGVYWVDVLGVGDEGVRIRNLPGRGKLAVELSEATIEPTYLHPLLRWGDVDAWRAEPSAYLLMPQDVDRRTGIDLETMRKEAPATLAYLEQFEATLRRRAAYQRYQGEAPFYSMYNVGPYTVAEHRVVWRRMDRRIRAAVLEPIDVEGLGRGTPIPQETCVLLAVDSADEAHYAAAMLNGSLLNLLAISHSVRGGKGFGSPGMLEHLRLEKFRPWDARHQKLALCSREAHAAAARGDDTTAIEQEIDLLVGRLRELDHDEIAAVREETAALVGVRGVEA